MKAGSYWDRKCLLPCIVTGRLEAFEETLLYEAIITNDVRAVRHVLEEGARGEVGRRSLEGWSYLHLAVQHYVSPPLLSLLLTRLSPALRDCDGLTPLEMTLLRYRSVGHHWGFPALANCWAVSPHTLTPAGTLQVSGS